MTFKVKWTPRALKQFNELKDAAAKAHATRQASGKTKASEQEGLFKQVKKCIDNLVNNPRHPSLRTHEYDSLPHPWKKGDKVWEAYAQNDTPGAYRVFWCYGKARDEITIIAITSHP